MAWNPSPKVAAARDFGEMFDYSQVLIIGINREDGTYGISSYGETVGLCADAEKMARKVATFIEKGSMGYF